MWFPPVPLAIIFTHWFADWFCQNDWMAINKSKQAKPLLVHVAIVTIFLFGFGWKFALVNGLIHLATDFWTSRLNAYLYQRGPEWRHWFFVSIGFDQFLHYAAYSGTLYLSTFYQ